MKIYKSKKDKPILDWQWKEPSLRNLTNLILKFTPQNKGHALDVGCGSGRVSFALGAQEFDVKGIDIEERVINLARSITTQSEQNLQFEVADFRESGLVEQGYYDLVVCSEVLEHISDYHRLLENMYIALKPGWRIIITIPLYMEHWSVIDDYAGHVHRFTLDEIERDLKKFSNLKYVTTGFPFYRLFVLIHLLILRLFRQKHSIEKIWGYSGMRVIASLLYPLVRVDNFFAFTRMGDMLVVSGDKKF